MSDLEQIASLALGKIQSSASVSELEEIRVSVLGKKGSLSAVLAGLGKLPPEERKAMGAKANTVKQNLEQAIEAKRESLGDVELNQRLQSERVDVTLPGRRASLGGLHPVTLATRRMVEVLSKVGFELALGPEAETDYMNFEAVNIPPDHPARDMQDTFFLGPGVVLRTHTSAVQSRMMRERKWPLRILCPGAVYRCDHDATHSPMFHQLEGLWVDQNVTMADLKGVLEYFVKELFGSSTQIRLRPSYFQFVEPGAEVDVSWGKTSTGETRWLEILGAGMVHPRLFEMAGYDAKEATGFAFGLGIDRIAMLLYGVSDLRLMFQNDIRFLRQFS